MDVAVVSLVALGIAIALSCFAKINVGVIAIVMAWAIGVYVAGMPLGEVLAGFPSQLFLTLAGVTLFFTVAQVNGTLAKIAHRAVRLCRGNVGLIPIMFFFLTMFLAFIGPGSIAAVALVAPTAMAVAGQTGVSAFLMAIMLANGSSAASLSPFGPTGIIVNGLMGKLGFPDLVWSNFLSVAIAHTVVGFLGYFLFGGLALFARPALGATAPAAGDGVGPTPGDTLPLGWRHWLTVALIVAILAGVTLLSVNVGMLAFAATVVLVLAGAGDDALGLKTMPWAPIVMVSGVTVLVTLLEKTGGMDLFSTLLAQASSLETITGFTAAVTGAISIFSSTSSVVLPAFLPTIPGLIAKLGGGDKIAIAYSMIIGAHLVDVSPLSTTGALCIAAAAPGTDTRKLFLWMLAWGFSMTLVAALGCYLVLGVFWWG
jgi:di/tricarboxylate transporter